MLIGNSGTGKTKLPILFSNYLSHKLKKEDIIIKSVNSLGKASSNREWHLKRDALEEVLPVLPFEGQECSFTINDSFSSVGKFKLDPRFRFKDKDLINYLLKLQDENPIQDLNLKIKVGERVVNSYFKCIYDISKDLEDIDSVEDLISNPNLNLFDMEFYFLIFEKINKSNEDDFLRFFDLYSDTNRNFISIINFTYNTILSSKFLDRVSVIELDNLDLSKYFYLDSLHKPKFCNLDYLEFNVVDSDVVKCNSDDLKEILKEIECNNSNLWDLLYLELDSLIGIFRNLGIAINFRVIDEILKFMVVSWKYEGEPLVWNNWMRYLDSQIKQKLLPKIMENYNKRGIECLLEFCGSKLDGFDGDFMKYPRSFFKIKNMISSSKWGDTISFFNSFEYEVVDRSSLYSESSDVLDDGQDVVEGNFEEPFEKENEEFNYSDYIYKQGSDFIVNKLINGNYMTFGRYESFIDAKLIIDILEEHNWDLNNIDKNEHIYIGSGFYYVIDFINGKLEILKRFDTYSSASKYFKEKFIEHDMTNNDSKHILIFNDYRIDKEDNIYVLKKDDKPRKWGYFISIEDAILVGDLLVKNKWNLDNLSHHEGIYFKYDLYWVIKVLMGSVYVLGRFESYKEAFNNMDYLIRSFSSRLVKDYSNNDLSKYGDHIVKRNNVFSVIFNDTNYGYFDSLNDARVAKYFIENYNLDDGVSILQFEDDYYCINMDNKQITIIDAFDNEIDAKNHLNNYGGIYFDSFDSNREDIHSSIMLHDEIDDLTGWEKLVFESIMQLEKNLFSINDLKDLDMFEIYQFEDDSLESLVVENLNKLAEKGIIKVFKEGYYKKMV